VLHEWLPPSGYKSCSHPQVCVLYKSFVYHCYYVSTLTYIVVVFFSWHVFAAAQRPVIICSLKLKGSSAGKQKDYQTNYLKMRSFEKYKYINAIKSDIFRFRLWNFVQIKPSSKSALIFMVNYKYILKEYMLWNKVLYLSLKKNFYKNKNSI